MQHYRPARWLLPLVLLLGGGTGVAQSLEATVAGGGFGVALREQSWAGLSLDAGLGLQQGALSFGAQARATMVASLLGSVVVEAAAGFEAGELGLAVAARGGAGPLALRAGVQVGSAEQLPPWPLASSATARFRALPAGRWRTVAELSLQWRPQRDLRIGVEPALRWHEGAVDAALALSARRAGVASSGTDAFDLSLELRTLDLSGLLPQQATLQLHRVPRRAAESSWGVRISSEGVGVLVAQSFTLAGVPARLTGAWGGELPGEERLDLQLTTSHRLSAGELHLTARLQSQGGWSLRATLRSGAR